MYAEEAVKGRDYSSGMIGGQIIGTGTIEGGLERLAGLIDRAQSVSNNCNLLADRLGGGGPMSGSIGEKRSGGAGIVGNLRELCDRLEASLSIAHSESQRALSVLG